ncbi:unnamed protein product [Phaeothamnion confervicola]
MPHFFFRVLDVTDKVIQGSLDAPSESLANERLKKIYKKVISLREEEIVAGAAVSKKGPRVKLEPLSLYTRQLAVMLNAGISINRVLRFLTQGEDVNMNLISACLAESVEGGNSLSMAMSEQPRCFNPTYVALVRAGEKSGRLERALLKLADLQEKIVKLKKRMVSTFAYPAVIGLVCALNAALFVFYIIPIMLPLFSSLNVVLPWPTRVVLWTTEVVHEPVFLGGLALLSLISAVVGLKMWRNSRSRYWIDLSLTRLPVFGHLITLNTSARVLYTMATLLDAGVGLPDCLVILSEVAGNLVTSERLKNARGAMLDGNSVFRSMQMFDVFPSTALQMLKVGEESGRLSEMVGRIAIIFEEDTDTQLDRFAALVEPLLMGVMGSLVAFIVLATFLPVISLISQF